jgi:hypothetical protein
MGMRRPATSSAMMVPSPLASSVTPTSNFVSTATSTVAGNIVSTCWKPRLSMAPIDGTSSGMKPAGRPPEADGFWEGRAI